METYEIPAENLDKLELRINQLARKADKLGFEPPALEILGERFVPIIERDAQGHSLGQTGLKRKVYDVTVSGEAPKIERWNLVAIIDHYSAGERGVNIVHQIAHREEIKVPEEFRTIEQRCDQCGLTRNRKNTFALMNQDTPRWLMVGSSCLKDYLGHENPDALARFYSHIFELMKEAVDEDWGGGASVNYMELGGYLATVAATIEIFGWVSRSEARKKMLLATADAALLPKEPKVNDSHRELALETIRWAREELAAQENLSDYDWNLVATLGHDYLHMKNIGIAASAIMAHKRSQGINGNGEAPTSKHQGEIGKRIDRTLTVTKRLDLEGYSYNQVYRITIMEDEDGNVYVWKTSAKKLIEGETYQVKGTVKEHDDYNGTAQTVLTRCKVTCPECGGKIEWVWKDRVCGQIFGCSDCYDKETAAIDAQETK